jgi:hypothetical protein
MMAMQFLEIRGAGHGLLERRYGASGVHIWLALEVESGAGIGMMVKKHVVPILYA